MTTTRTELMDRLLSLPALLTRAEADLLAAASALASAKQALECRESDLVLTGAADGPNEGTRKARLHVGCLAHAEAALRAQERRDAAGAAVRCLQVEAACLRAAAGLIGGEEEP